MKYADKDVMLTPKNLYRLLTGRLQIRQASEILPKAMLQGLTLVPFWRELLQDAVPQDVLDRLLPVDGPHPRMQSSLMNRSTASPMPPLLRHALPLTETLLLRLTENAMGFLKRHMYRPDQFFHTVASFEETCAAQDVFLTASISQHLRSLSLQAEHAAREGTLMQPFLDGCHLAWLALLALYGPLMGCDEMTSLRMKEEAQPEQLFRQWKRRQWQNSRPQLLTRNNSAILRTPLPREEYVPLPVTPESVSYRLEQGGKLMLCGVGGCGKTELLRQALRLVEDQGTYSRIACVQYEQSLARSYFACFPQLQEKGLEGIVAAVRTLLEKREEGRTLLVIDNMDTPPEEDEDAALLPWYGCDVVITSRLQGMSGFSVIPVPPLTEKQALRLFAMASCMGEADCARDFRGLYQRVSGHPLMLKLLGRICCARCWTTAEMNRRLDESQPDRQGAGGSRDMQTLRDSLAALYPMARLSAQEKMLMRLICHLRDASWKPGALLPFTPDVTEDEGTLADMLLQLSDQGWLMHSPEGFSVHPALREALSATPCSCDAFPLLWRAMADRLGHEMTSEDRELSLDVQRLLACMSALNNDGVKTALGLEMSLQTRPIWQFPRNLFSLHSHYLDTHAHTPVDEINLWLGRLMYAYVAGELTTIPGIIDALAGYDRAELLKTEKYSSMLNLLECAGDHAERKRVIALFDRLAPEDECGEQMISYLNFYAGYIRKLRTNQRAALELLTRAQALIREKHMQGSLAEIANDTRMAYVLADMQRFDETLPLMRRVLRSLELRGYSPDSQTVIATRNSYLYFLGKAESAQEALKGLRDTLRSFEARDDRASVEYYKALNSQCVLMASLMPIDGAEEAARGLITLVRQQLGLEVKDIARALSISGWILAQAGALSEGMGLQEEALSYARMDSSVLDCIIEGRKAEIMLRLGHREEAVKMAGRVLRIANEQYPDLAEQVAFVCRIIEENG